MCEPLRRDGEGEWGLRVFMRVCLGGLVRKGEVEGRKICGGGGGDTEEVYVLGKLDLNGCVLVGV